MMWALGHLAGGWWKYQLFNLFLLCSSHTYCGWPRSTKLAVHTALCTVPKCSALPWNQQHNEWISPKPKLYYITKLGCSSTSHGFIRHIWSKNISIIFWGPKLRHFKVILVIRNLHYSWANMDDNLLVLKSDKDEVDSHLHVCNML